MKKAPLKAVRTLSIALLTLFSLAVVVILSIVLRPEKELIILNRQFETKEEISIPFDSTQYKRNKWDSLQWEFIEETGRFIHYNDKFTYGSDIHNLDTMEIYLDSMELSQNKSETIRLLIKEIRNQ